MKKEIYILFTAGRGPVECTLAVHGIQNKFKSYLASRGLAYEIISQNKGDFHKSMETIVFKVVGADHALITHWLGTIQWICQSPIRKFHKRKNWYIKCQEITMPDKIQLSNKDVVVQSYRASGPGGQHRNKVETAIRLIHKTSGLIVTAADGKSQAQNKKKAWLKLESLLKAQNDQLLQNFNADQWTSQLEIERGSPVMTFIGPKFKV